MLVASRRQDIDSEFLYCKSSESLPTTRQDKKAIASCDKTWQASADECPSTPE